jgi:hypothetical protein
MPKVLAYDSRGNIRELVPIAVGDEIDWKRNGTAGFYRAVVRELDLHPLTGAVLRLRIHLLEHDGRQVYGRTGRWIRQRGVMRVHKGTGR